MREIVNGAVPPRNPLNTIKECLTVWLDPFHQLAVLRSDGGFLACLLVRLIGLAARYQTITADDLRGHPVVARGVNTRSPSMHTLDEH